MSNSNCVFCQIINGIKPSIKVYEDELTIAIFDLYPVANGHILVIPKKHSQNLLDIEPVDISAAAITVTKICRAVKNILKCEGVNVLANNEKVAMQRIMHTHFHVIPRFLNDQIVFGAKRELLKEDPELVLNFKNFFSKQSD